MSDGMGAVLAAIAELGRRFDGLEQRFDGLEQRFDGLEQRFSKLEQEMTRLRVDVMARLDRQQDLLNSIRNDVGVNMAATDLVRDANLETRKDLVQLADQVSLIHRRLMQLEERVDRRDGT
jgi:hypothetical protein